jgi:hypothetical protein
MLRLGRVPRRIDDLHSRGHLIARRDLLDLVLQRHQRVLSSLAEKLSDLVRDRQLDQARLAPPELQFGLSDQIAGVEKHRLARGVDGAGGVVEVQVAEEDEVDLVGSDPFRGQRGQQRAR